jgi:hypothetical protein
MSRIASQMPPTVAIIEPPTKPIAQNRDQPCDRRDDVISSLTRTGDLDTFPIAHRPYYVVQTVVVQTAHIPECFGDDPGCSYRSQIIDEFFWLRSTDPCISYPCISYYAHSSKWDDFSISIASLYGRSAVHLTSVVYPRFSRLGVIQRDIFFLFKRKTTIAHPFRRILMMQFKFHSLRSYLLLSAGLSLGLSMTPVSEARQASNGTNLNGISLNGVVLNGIFQNGTSFNGANLNGLGLNGVVLNGTKLQFDSGATVSDGTPRLQLEGSQLVLHLDR